MFVLLFIDKYKEEGVEEEVLKVKGREGRKAALRREGRRRERHKGESMNWQVRVEGKGDRRFDAYFPLFGP